MASPDFGEIYREAGALFSRSENPFSPNWTVVRKKHSASLLELCCYAYDIDLSLVWSQEGSLKEHWKSPSVDEVRKSLETDNVLGESPEDLHAVISKNFNELNDEYQEWWRFSFMVYGLKCSEMFEIAKSHTSDRGGALNVVGEVEYCGQQSPLVRVDNFVEWADEFGLPLSEEFPRSKVKSKLDTDKELNEAYKVIAGLVSFIKDHERLNEDQGSISSKLDIDGIGKRRIDGIFSKAKQEK